MQEIPCPLCGRFSQKTAIMEHGYRGVRCPRCELIYISPRPSWEEIRRLYGGGEGEPSTGGGWSSPGKRLKAKAMYRLLRPFLRGRQVLELGPGGGFFLETMRNLGFQVHGIELNGSRADFLQRQRRFPCESRPLSRASFGGKTFHLIYHSNVLSHFYDPVAEFLKLRAALRDEGIMVLETGNLGEVRPEFYRYYPGFRYPEHLFFFGEKSLRLLLARTGWELVRLYRFPLRHALRLEGVWERWRERWRRGGKRPPGPAATRPAPRRLLWSLPRLLVEWLTEYVLPSRLGRHFPGIKAGEPQTLIVVARKRPEARGHP